MGKKMISINFWDCNFLYNIGSILALKNLDEIEININYEEYE